MCKCTRLLQYFKLSAIKGYTQFVAIQIALTGGIHEIQGEQVRFLSDLKTI